MTFNENQRAIMAIDKRIAQCEQLSLEARGLYFYMQSLPKGYKISEQLLAQNAGCSLDKIKRILKELFTLGLLTREFTHNDKGNRKSTYILYGFEKIKGGINE